MSISTFPASPTAAPGADVELFPIGGGISLVQKEFPVGVYAFRANSNTATEASGTITFRDASDVILGTITLVDSNTGGTSSPFVGSLSLGSVASSILYSGPLSVNGWLEVSYGAGIGSKRILILSTTQADFVLPFNAEAYVFGAGGGGGSGGSVSGGGGGGGGSGFLSETSVNSGTYNVVIGAGGGQSNPGSILSNGLLGGSSSFGATSASGGGGGLFGNNDATGGNGGSGGGAGRKPGDALGFGFGGINGAAGGDNGTATGGTGSGVAQSLFYLPTSEAGAGSTNSGVFYAGGNGGNASNNTTGQTAAANSASGGGGGSRASGNPSAGSTGGSGVIYLVEE